MTERTPIPQARMPELISRLQDAGVFADVRAEDDAIRCRARDIDSDAHYVLTRTPEGVLMVRFETPDRWLSESVEADLYHSSDSLEELLEESLDELEWPVDSIAVTTFKHYRSDELRYVFENPIPERDDPVEDALVWILAYEATFHELGDVSGEEED